MLCQIRHQFARGFKIQRSRIAEFATKLMYWTYNGYLTNRKEFTLLFPFPIILHKITTRFPKIAMTPNNQIQYISTLFLSSSSQEDTSLTKRDVQRRFGRLFSAWQHMVKWSTSLRKEIEIIQVNMQWKIRRCERTFFLKFIMNLTMNRSL